MAEGPKEKVVPRRRVDDGLLCWVAMRAGQFWDFIDKRDIDKHALSLGVFYGTVLVLRWAFSFAESATAAGVNGLEIAAVIAAVTAPYVTLQGAALKFYFDVRTP